MIDPQTQEWSQIIDLNVSHGTRQQRLDLLQKIVATSDRYLLLPLIQTTTKLLSSNSYSPHPIAIDQDTNI